MDAKMPYPVCITAMVLLRKQLNLSLELLALYKEVQEQYESGRLDVPNDVTLLFADDNFGTIRRLPCSKETERKGGAGVRATPVLYVYVGRLTASQIYYHFEYVGDPRSYKWTNSNSLV